MTTFDIKKFEQKNISKDAILKIDHIIETSYEDGSVWVGYIVDGHWGYEISFEYQDNDSDMKKVLSDVKNGFLKIDDKKTLTVDEMINKPSIEICSKNLKELIEYCCQSENEMWFVEYDELDDYGVDLEKLEDEVFNLGLYEYFEFDNGDCAITVFGGIATKFLF